MPEPTKKDLEKAEEILKYIETAGATTEEGLLLWEVHEWYVRKVEDLTARVEELEEFVYDCGKCPNCGQDPGCSGCGETQERTCWNCETSNTEACLVCTEEEAAMEAMEKDGGSGWLCDDDYSDLDEFFNPEVKP